HPTPASFEQDIVGLDVAVDDTDRVRGAQRVGGVDHDAARLLRRQPAPAFEPGRERLPVDVRHHEVDEAVRPFADAVDRDNVRVGQPGGGLRLAQEPDADLLAEGELRREYLDGHLAFQALVTRLVHDAHPAAADLPFDRIGAAQRLAQARHQRIVGLGHAVPRRGARIDLAARGRSCNLQKGLDLHQTRQPLAVSRWCLTRATLTANGQWLMARWQAPASLTACGRNATPRRGVSTGTVDAVSCGTWCHTPAPT